MRFLDWVERLMTRKVDVVGFFMGCFALFGILSLVVYHSATRAVTAFYLGR